MRKLLITAALLSTASIPAMRMQPRSVDSDQCAGRAVDRYCDDISGDGMRKDLSGWVSRAAAPQRRKSEFTCADCERYHRCGAATTDSCEFRMEQTARRDWMTRRVVSAMARSVPWG